ncbi:MAG: MBL fold metallo-hydrolase [Acidimicrobiales bacterium]
MSPTDRVLGPHTTVLLGLDGGRYPAGNTVLVQGRGGTAIIDPSTSLRVRDDLPHVDHVLLTHTHEDHVAGVHHFPDARVLVHESDLVGIRSIEGLLQMFGMQGAAADAFRETLRRDFTYEARPDAIGVTDGHVVDLGDVTITWVHLPGHTAGHSGLLIEPDGVFVTGDIDLSSFGPLYGDTWSSVDDFERSLVRAREVVAEHYVTFHHKGVIDGRDDYVAAIDAFAAVIPRREAAMVAFADEPRSLDDFVAHRFVYRPHVTLPFVEPVERRSAEMSLSRLVAAGRLRATDDGRWQAC